MLRTIEDVEYIDSIPGAKDKYVQKWIINTEISVLGQCRPVVFYLGFKNTTPFSLPDVYCLDFKFGEIPHIGSDKKLCLFEEGITYNINDYCNILKQVLRKSKKLIKESLEATNSDEFKNEIISYWSHRYKNEKIEGILDNLLIEETPSNTQKLYKFIIYEGTHKKIILSPNKSYGDNLSCQQLHIVYVGEALFIHNFTLKSYPPYDITGTQLCNMIESHPDKRNIISFINSNDDILLIFNLFDTNIYGGFFLEIPTFRKQRGFRIGKLKNYHIISTMELKHRVLNRMIIKPYTKSRIIERSAGTIVNSRNFLIAGLGSIGSQLVKFLYAYTDVSFCLIDNDILRVDNIGRHSLGLMHVGGLKTSMISEELKSLRPDIIIKTYDEDICDFCESSDFSIELINTSAIFMCIGDFMSESFFLHTIQRKNETNKPIFILWLEPYAIGGHMIYISPTEKEPYSYYCTLFDKTQLYKHNIIDKQEYLTSPEKFIKRDVGCNGHYTNYSGNDVMLFLSSMYPIVDKLLLNPGTSKSYRWFGNTFFAQDLDLKIIGNIHEKGQIEVF